MSNSAKKSLEDVIEAMQNLNRHFEQKIEALRQKGTDEKELQNLTRGAMAMKDACGIYLAWANHYIERLNKIEEIEEDEEESSIISDEWTAIKGFFFNIPL